MILTRWSKSPERNRLREPRLPHDINADTSDRVRTRWQPALHPITENEPPQDVPVALLLILGAVAHQRHVAPSRELLHQAQRKLLTMVLDGSAALVDRAIKEKLLSILL